MQYNMYIIYEAPRNQRRYGQILNLEDINVLLRTVEYTLGNFTNLYLHQYLVRSSTRSKQFLDFFLISEQSEVIFIQSEVLYVLMYSNKAERTGYSTRCHFFL